MKNLKRGLIRYSLMINSSLLLGWGVSHLLASEVAKTVWMCGIPLSPLSWLWLTYQENILLKDLDRFQKIYWVSMAIAIFAAFIIGGLQ